MLDIVAVGLGLVAGGALSLLAFGLLLSIPVMGWRALQVVLGREWVPLTYNLRSLAGRKLTTVATFAILGLVVFVLTAALMLAAGIEHTLESTGSPANVKISRTTAVSEWTSWFTEDELKGIAVLPGIARDGAGKPLVSPELVVLIWAGRLGSSDPDEGANLTVRGVNSLAFDMHRVRQIQGRPFAVGTQEIVIGRALTGRFPGAELGGTMRFAERDWKVVGIADHGGTAHDSEIWGDVDVMIATFKRGVATVTAVLETPGSFAALSAALENDRQQGEVKAQRERLYWRSLSENYVGFVRLLGGAMTVVFSFGAVLGALNTMYAQVAARTRELGTLRAIGFKPRAVLTSIVMESVLSSLAAGATGIIAASLLVQTRFTLTTAQTHSEISYGFHLTPALVLGSLAFSGLMGYAGGLLPAVRAAGMPIVHAVRAD